jgi:formate hydrogenlyase regulatory protein HycA
MGAYSSGDEDNMFWGRVVAIPSLAPEPRPAGWYPEKRWYAVLHRFDGWGHHLGTDHWFAGMSAPAGEDRILDRASAKLDEMVAALEDVVYGDIEIRLFRVEIDGHAFGMMDASQPGQGPAFAEQVAMEPGNLLFRFPWDGRYSS